MQLLFREWKEARKGGEDYKFWSIRKRFLFLRYARIAAIGAVNGPSHPPLGINQTVDVLPQTEAG